MHFIIFSVHSSWTIRHCFSLISGKTRLHQMFRPLALARYCQQLPYIAYRYHHHQLQILFRQSFSMFQCFFQCIYDKNTFFKPVSFSRNNNIGTVRQSFSYRVIGFTSHDDRMSVCNFFEVFQIFRKVP